MSDRLVNVKADTARDFVDAGHKAMSSRTKLGETKYELGSSFTMQPTIAKATLTLKLSTTRVHWAGPAKTAPDKANLDAMKKIEAMNAAHEENHRDTYTAAFDKAKDDLEDQLVGKTQKEAASLLEDLHQTLLAACEKLHASEGMIDVTDSSGKISISESAEGPGGCKSRAG